MTQKIGDEIYSTLKEISTKHKVSVTTLRAYIKAGKIIGKKFGRNILVSETSLKDYLNGR